MIDNIGNSEQATSQSSSIPRFIQSQLAHPPIGPNESAAEFKSLFHELASATQAGQRSAAEYTMLFQATVLTFRTVALERIRAAIVQHMRPEAVVTLLQRAEGEFERGSIAFSEVYDRRKEYFANKEGKTRIETKFARSGYDANAVDVAAFQLALPSLALIDRQVNAAQRTADGFSEGDRSPRYQTRRSAPQGGVCCGRPRPVDGDRKA